MDPKIKMPEIKADVNKVDDDKKKMPGLLGLWGGGGSGAAGGLGGLGAGVAGGGGLLATKAGMLALIVMGSAAAGGIGLAGYKIFGPGEADRIGGTLSLFAPKPQTQGSGESAPVKADGSSSSLEYMAQAVSKENEAGNAAQTATDTTSGAPVADTASMEAGARAVSGSDGSLGGGAVGSMGRGLANAKKLGALSGVTGGASTSASASTAKFGENSANASAQGALSSFSKGGPGARSSSARGVAGRSGRRAADDAQRVMVDQGGGKAASSFGAGKTYDGAAAVSGDNIGSESGAIGMNGVGVGGTELTAKTLTANALRVPNEQPLPPPKTTDVETELGKLVEKIAILGILATALYFAAKAITVSGPWTMGTVMIMGGILIGIGIAICEYAARIIKGTGAEPGQPLQGYLSAIGGLFAIWRGFGLMKGAWDAASVAKQGAAEAVPKNQSKDFFDRSKKLLVTDSSIDVPPADLGNPVQLDNSSLTISQNQPLNPGNTELHSNL